jgi:hypothetical protein
LPSHHAYDFHRLPDRVKRQIARSIADGDYHLREETATNSLFYVLRGLGLLIVAFFLWATLAGNFGQPEHDELWSNVAIGTGLAMIIGVIAYLGLVIRRRFKMNRDFGFAPGQYLFPYTLVDARRPQWQVVDLSQATGINVVEQLINGMYSHTTYAFSFPDAATRTWKISNKNRAQQFGTKLAALQSAAHDAYQRNDLASLLRLDPFFEIRRKNWEMPQNDAVPPSSRLKNFLVHPVVAAIATALVLAPVFWLVRNVGADYAMQAEAKRLNTEKAYVWYIDNGWFKVDEMRAAVPRIAFEEVKKLHSVTELRSLLIRYRNAGLQADVGKEIHVLYQAALAKFKDQAITSDPALLASMERLLQVLEQRGDPKVGIHFTRPGNEALGALDASIKQSEAKLGGKKIIPAALHFYDNSAAPREARIAAGLQGAFRSIFANDVLDLRVVGASNNTSPMLEITYQIAPSGSIFVSEENKEQAFVGLVARFQAALQAEPSAAPWRFDMEVAPPNHFTVEPNDAVTAGSPESRVYAVMAERAFDELGVKIRAAFFRQDSAAFKRYVAARKPPVPAPAAQQ